MEQFDSYLYISVHTNVLGQPCNDDLIYIGLYTEVWDIRHIGGTGPWNGMPGL